MEERALRNAIRFVALANLAYFVIEFSVARAIGSVSLFADSVDFLEDASVNFLILAALNWRPRARARVGMLLAGILLVPALAAFLTAWQKLTENVAPAATPLSLTALGALVVNLTCAFILAGYRHHRGSLTKAAFLSARNDALANLAIIAAGILTAWWPAIWPDLIVGIGVAVLNAGAAREVWSAAREEHATPQP